MFISKAEKQDIFATLFVLQKKIHALESDIDQLNWDIKAGRKAVVSDKSAPWGIKKDGSPRKRPGRPRLVMKVGAK